MIEGSARTPDAQVENRHVGYILNNHKVYLYAISCTGDHWANVQMQHYPALYLFDHDNERRERNIFNVIQTICQRRKDSVEPNSKINRAFWNFLYEIPCNSELMWQAFGALTPRLTHAVVPKLLSNETILPCRKNGRMILVSMVDVCILNSSSLIPG